MSSERPGRHDFAFRRGLRALAGHRPDLALQPLREAVEDCPPSAKASLSDRLYWLSIALLKLERTALALKSLASAQKLSPRGIARRAYLHWTNDFGMQRRPTSELDDFFAFHSIQVCRYLGTRPGGRFGSGAEHDAITRLVAEGWLRLKRSGILEGAGVEAKLRTFKEWRLEFPSAVTDRRWTHAARSEAGSAACKDPIVVDFRCGSVVKAEDRCPCGSGLPYSQCCGRVPSPIELA